MVGPGAGMRAFVVGRIALAERPFAFLKAMGGFRQCRAGGNRPLCIPPLAARSRGLPVVEISLAEC